MRNREKRKWMEKLLLIKKRTRRNRLLCPRVPVLVFCITSDLEGASFSTKKNSFGFVLVLDKELFLWGYVGAL